MALAAGWNSFRLDGKAFLNTVAWRYPEKTFADTTIPSPCHKDDGQTSLFLPGSGVGEHSDDCSNADLVVFSLLFLGVFATSYAIRTLLGPIVARRLLAAQGQNSKTLAEKLALALSLNAFHCLSAYFAVRVIGSKSWLWSMDQWWETMGTYSVDADVKFFFLLYAARYTSDLVFVVAVEHRRSDFWALVIHHVITVALIYLAAVMDLGRCGAAIILLFAWSDPPLLTAKACVYLSQHKDDWFQFIANRLFEIFVVVYFVTRNVVFNYMLWYYTAHIAMKVRAEETWPSTLRVATIGTLAVLSGLLWFWFYEIIKAAVNMASNDGKVEDTRSDDESEEDDDHPPKPIAHKKKAI